MALRRQRGVQTMQAILESAGISDDDLNLCLGLAGHDANFGFLKWLSHSAALGAAAGEAAEAALFGNTNKASAELAAIVQMSTLLLDGLIDDAPEVFPPHERAGLFGPLRRWLGPDPMPVSASAATAEHPVVTLLYKGAAEWARRIQGSEAWSGDESVRVEVWSAVEAALRAENNGTRAIFHGMSGQLHVEQCRTAIRDKSVAPVWVSALMPICVRGWPKGFDRHAYRDAVEAMGTFVGWMDDIDDLLLDLEEGFWSDALLDVYLCAGEPPSGPQEAFVRRLAETLALQSTRISLAEKGVTLYKGLVLAFEETGFDGGPILQLIDDVSLIGLDRN